MGCSAYFLVGPTASGKSAVAQRIAEREGRAVVSADSMNIYRGMDIGTAKPSPRERGQVSYAGIDLAEPTENFSVAAYLEAVRPAFGTGREPIVVGGTGLYIKCLTEGFDEVPPANPALRAELEALDFQTLEARAQAEASALYARLTAADRKNPRRLVRILEKSCGAGIPVCIPEKSRGADIPVCPSQSSRAGAPVCSSWNSGEKPVLVGLRIDREELHRRIARRVDEMYAEGLLEEARGLMRLGLSATALQAIGYAEAFAVLENKMTVEEARGKTIVRTRQLAKRQMTWLRNQLNVEWIDAARFQSLERLADAVSSLWKRLGPAPVAAFGKKDG